MGRRRHVGGRRRSRSRPLDEFTAAQKRIGWTAETRVRWLLGFAKRQRLYQTRLLETASETDASALQWEALAFAKGMRGFTISTSELPPWRLVTEAHTNLWQMILAELRHGRPAEVEGTWRGVLSIGSDGRITGHSLTGESPFLDAFLIRAYEALLGLAAEKRRLRFCPKCKQPFVSRGRQLYDSSTCSQSHRTALYRESHRKEFRAYRKTYYRKRVAERLGRPVEKIPFRTLKRKETK